MRIHPKHNNSNKRQRQRQIHYCSLPFQTKGTGMVALSFFIFSSLILLVHSSSPNFDPDINLFGDAHITTTHVQLTRPSPSSSGLLLRRNPITFSSPTTSLSTSFSFSISPSPSPGHGLLLLLLPGNHSFPLSSNNNYVAIEFDTSKDPNVAHLNANHVGTLVSVAVANVSSVNLVLNNGQKLSAWVDYEAASKVLEVRLGKFGEPRPVAPIVSRSIDLVKIWGGKRVFVGISASNDRDSVQVVSVYSWKLSLRKGSKGLHSQPADPRGYSEVGEGLVDRRKGGFGTLKVLAEVIFGTGCVALVAFVVLFMWVIFFQRNDEESLGKIPEHPAADIRYERIDVAVDKNTEDDEN